MSSTSSWARLSNRTSVAIDFSEDRLGVGPIGSRRKRVARAIVKLGRDPERSGEIQPIAALSGRVACILRMDQSDEKSPNETFDVVKVPLSDIETAWQLTDLRGSRLVVVP